MAIYRLLRNAAFGPDDVRYMTDAYEGALKVLGLIDRDDPITELIAKEILDIAQTGERNAQLITARAIEQLGLKPKFS